MFSFFPSANKASIKLKKSLAQGDSKMWYEKNNYMDENSTWSQIQINEKKRKSALQVTDTLHINSMGRIHDIFHNIS